MDPQDHGLSGLEALSFDYVVKWPLSLIISRKKIVHYQLLFRFLFYTKHIERIINNAWRASTQLMKQYGCDIMYNRAAILRGKMLNFVLNLQTYVTNEVIEPHWHTLMSTLKTVQNIDQVLTGWVSFLDFSKNIEYFENNFYSIESLKLKLFVEFIILLQLREKTQIST